MLSSSLRSILFMSCFVYGSYSVNAYAKRKVPVKTFGNKSYYFSDTFKASYINANAICNELEMQLLSIHNKEINDFLYQHINSANEAHRYWTSGTDIIVSGEWIWLAAAQPVTYNKWAPKEPDSLVGRCIRAELHKNFDLLWHAWDCKLELNFICESPDNDDFEIPITYIQCTSTNNQCTSKTPSFYIVEEKVSYNTAIEKCEARGQMLVSIQNEAKQKAVAKFLEEKGMKDALWTSGNRVYDKERWRWLSGQIVKYTFWYTGQPDNHYGNEECMAIYKGDTNVAGWHDVPCDYKYYYICQSKP